MKVAYHILFINETEQRIAKVKIGFSWTLFFWTHLFALPLFIRRVYPWAFGIAALAVFVLLMDPYKTACYYPAGSMLSYHELGGVIIFVLSFYLGFCGNEITARHYLKNGYRFAEPDSALVILAKAKWGMTS